MTSHCKHALEIDRLSSVGSAPGLAAISIATLNITGLIATLHTPDDIPTNGRSCPHLRVVTFGSNTARKYTVDATFPAYLVVYRLL